MANSFARTIPLSLSFALLSALAGCAPLASDPTESRAAEAASALQCSGHPQPVIFDTDMDFDDASALALLCQEHKQGRIQLVAVTVANDGVGLPGSAIRHARCVLEACGLLDEVPVADGSPAGVNPPAPELQGAIEAVLSGTFAECTQGTEPSAKSAAQLIAGALNAAHEPVRIVTTGPLSNISAALKIHGVKANKIEKMYVMGGAFGVGGNLFGGATGTFDNSQELNIWMDPPAAQHVFSEVTPWTVQLVPLDATNHVPITPAFVEKLATDRHTPEANLVHSIVTQPIASFAIGLGLFYWWDPLTAIAATSDDDVVTFDRARISVVQSGAQAGRTIESSKGAKVWTALDADQALFEQTFLDGLNGREADDDHHHAH